MPGASGKCTYGGTGTFGQLIKITTHKMELKNPESPAARPVTRSPFLDSTGLLEQPDALRRRAAEDGYLFFKNFLPRDDVMELRAAILAVIGRHGWLQAGQDRFGGKLDAEATARIPDEDIGTWGTGEACYREVQKLEAFHRFPHHPKLVALYRTLLQDEVLVHARTIARMIVPHRANFPTPPHQDYPYVQGSAKTWTCWMPLGDCPRDLGGLSVLRGSHRAGHLPVESTKGAVRFGVRLCPWESEWMEGDYEAGDILTFNSLVVHKALRATDREQLRLSLDVRYQALSEPVERGSLLPHIPGLTWEDIYPGWPDSELKYYWEKLPLKFSPWDEVCLHPKRRIC